MAAVRTFAGTHDFALNRHHEWLLLTDISGYRGVSISPTRAIAMNLEYARGWRPALALSVLLLASCGKSPEKPQAVPSLTVTTGALEQVELNRMIDSAGAVMAWEEMSLGVELAGVRVAEVLVEVGDAVKKGDVLLRLDRRSLQAELRQHQAMLEQAKANQVLAHANAERARAMRERKLMAIGDIDQMIAGERVAEAAVLNADAALASAQLRLDFADLRAPDDGLISSRMVQPGRVVGAGEELLRLIRQGRLEWRAELPEADFAKVSIGALVNVLSDAGPTSARVRKVSPGLDPVSRTGTVFADIPVPGSLKAGMFAHGQIVLGNTTTAMLPSAAIVERDGYRYAFVLGAKDLVAQRRIEVGQSFAERTEVLSGIVPTDRVVIQGAAFLSDGDRVRVVAADSGVGAQ
jgi:RND family efflux transporter MFP subunit